MYPVFHLLAGALVNDRIAWYLELAIYWLVWGTIFPLSIIGKDKIKALIRPGKPNRRIILPITIIVVGALASRLFVPGMGYEKESAWILLLLISTSPGNGFFEEVLWRGVYVTLFPNHILMRMILPSIWFGVWHYVPGSVFHDSITGLTGLMVGSMMMGLVLSYMTKKTNTLWWSILAHTIGGIIMVI
jgi:membrane protease YdiL (CAAX protease family)